MTLDKFETIKKYQRDYQETYGEKLYIDWAYMKDVPKKVYYRKYAPDLSLVDPEKILKKCLKKYKANLEIIKDRSTRLHMHGNTKERMAVIEYSKRVLSNRCNAQEAANLINRDRSLLYYYASM
jgi:hypothetical protein